jgi:PIN domain nuclease of toxin-antitoxin system
MRLLLDTHTFIWWDSHPEKLSQTALSLLQDQSNTLILSVVSVWEMQIKLQLGKLKLNLPLSELIESQQQINNLQILSVSLAHALALDSLPNHHNDPFDRLLVAQANVEDVFLVSKDAKIAQYSLQLIW